MVDTSTFVVHMPAMKSGSGYLVSKLAATKVWETFARKTGNPVIRW